MERKIRSIQQNAYTSRSSSTFRKFRSAPIIRAVKIAGGPGIWHTKSWGFSFWRVSNFFTTWTHNLNVTNHTQFCSLFLVDFTHIDCMLVCCSILEASTYTWFTEVHSQRCLLALNDQVLKDYRRNLNSAINAAWTSKFSQLMEMWVYYVQIQRLLSCSSPLRGLTHTSSFFLPWSTWRHVYIRSLSTGWDRSRDTEVRQLIAYRV